MPRRFLLRLVPAVCIWAAAIQNVHAQAFFFGNESLGYTGTWTQYSDANLTTQVNSGTVFQSDLGVYLSSNSSLSGMPPSSDGTLIQTITYVTNAGTNGPTSGNYIGNMIGIYPSSNNIQVFYDPATGKWQAASVGSTSGGSNSLFDPVVGPGNANPMYGTLGQATGEWLSYTFNVVATGSAAAVEGPTGTWTKDQINTTFANGTFHGVFANDNTTDFFVVDLNINSINAARAANMTNPPAKANGFFGPLDGFQGIVPEPASCLAFVFAIGASATFGWRRKNRLELISIGADSPA